MKSETKYKRIFNNEKKKTKNDINYEFMLLFRIAKRNDSELLIYAFNFLKSKKDDIEYVYNFCDKCNLLESKKILEQYLN